MILRRYEKQRQLVIEKAKKIDYSRLKVDELKAIAKEKGIEGYSDMKKAELIEKLG